MRHSSPIAWALLLLASSGCGGAQPTTDAPKPSEAARAPAPPEVTPVTLAPVSAPPGTFLWGRVKSPARLVDSVVAATAIPLNWRGELEGESPELSRVVSLDAPIEVAMAIDHNPMRQPHGIVSFGVGSEGAVLAELERQGIAVRTHGESERWFSLNEASCALGPSLGATPARVVCSDDDESLAELLPYALRGLPGEQLSEAEVHVEVRAAPLQKAYKAQIRSLKLLGSMVARQIELDSPRFDRAAADAVLSLADEGILLAQDLERASFQLFEREAGDYDLRFTGKFRSSTSWTAGSFGLLGQRQTPAPDLFWKLPADSSAASFAHGLPTERARPLHDALIDLLGGLLEHGGLADKTRIRIEKTLREMLAYDGLVVSATGPQRVKEGELAPAWQLLGIEADAARYRKLFEEIAQVLSSADLRKAAGEHAKWLPELKARGALPGRPGSVLYEWKVSGDFDELFGNWTPEGKRGLGGAAQKLQHGFVALVPDGARTWLSWASEREQVSAPIDALFQSSSPRLDAVAGLSAMREASTVGSGFIKLEALAGPFFGDLDSGKRYKSWEELARSLPYAGKVPTTFHLRVEGGSAPAVEVVERVPHQLVADLTALLVHALSSQ